MTQCALKFGDNDGALWHKTTCLIFYWSFKSIQNSSDMSGRVAMDPLGSGMGSGAIVNAVAMMEFTWPVIMLK